MAFVSRSPSLLYKRRSWAHHLVLYIVLLHSASESFPQDALYILYRPCKISATISSSSLDLVALGEHMDDSSKQKTQLDVAYPRTRWCVFFLLLVVPSQEACHPRHRGSSQERTVRSLSSTTTSCHMPRPRAPLLQPQQLLRGRYEYLHRRIRQYQVTLSCSSSTPTSLILIGKPSLLCHVPISVKHLPILLRI